jgi:hypothetical protein
MDQQYTEYYSLIDTTNPVFGHCQFETLAEAKEALAQSPNTNFKIIKETLFN